MRVYVKLVFGPLEVASKNQGEQIIKSAAAGKGLVQEEEANGFFGYERIEVEVVDEKAQAHLPQ
jgi:hypothetical protein